MQLKVVFDTGGAAVAGVDHDAIIADIQAEVEKFASKAATQSPRRTETPPPRGAQGNIPAIEWLIQIATDPAMAKVYVNALVFAINEILQAVRTKDSKNKNGETKGKNEGGKEKASDDALKVKITVLGKEIVLPTAVSALKTILEQLGDQ